MKIIQTEELIPVIAGLCQKASYELPQDVLEGYKKLLREEQSPTGREILELLLENSDYAVEKQIPCCQDTGVCVVYLKVGQEVAFEGIPLYEAVNEGVRKGYMEGYLRISVIRDPIDRINTNDNTPAVVHYDIVPGENVEITIFPKGFGSENQNQLKMLTPAQGVEGFLDYVLKVVKEGAAMSCPPLVVGVGIGGTTEKAALLAKLALQRKIGQRNPVPYIAELEEKLLARINRTGIGPLGLGGNSTALDVFIEQYATHIAGFPVAVNLQCHANRHATAII